MSQAIINLIDEWAKRRRGELRQVKLWTAVLVLGTLALATGAGFMAWQVPRALKERSLWGARAERMQAPSEEASTPPIPPEAVKHARTRTVEFQVMLLAITRLLPRDARLHEAHLSFQPESGLVLTLRGMTLGFEPIKAFTERLRAVKLFSEITPVSVSRQESEGEARWSRFEMRLVLPTTDPATQQSEGTGGGQE